MVTNQNEEFAKIYTWWRTTQQTILKMFCQNTCNDTAIKTKIHFSHYKSMEILSYYTVVQIIFFLSVLYWSKLKPVSIRPKWDSGISIHFADDLIVILSLIYFVRYQQTEHLGLECTSRLSYLLCWRC